MALRIGIVGANRRRQGIGQHVARHLAALGAKVTAIAGSSCQSAEQTAARLAAQYGLHVRSYGSLGDMLAHEPLDAVAICSPDRFHRPHLAQALAACVHVLCEKPLVFEEGHDPAADARSIVHGFAAAGRVLMVNEQWPCTLPAFERLYPEADLRGDWPRSFSMLLSPDALGPEMIPNALPHALSLLAALTPTVERARPTSAEDISVEFAEIDGVPGAAADVRFGYVHADGRTQVAVTMRRAPEQPRPAAYAIDGRWALRRIEMPSYRMWLDRASGFGLRASDFRFQISDGPGDTSPDLKPEICNLKSAICNPKSIVPHPSAVPRDDPLKLLLADFLKQCERAAASGDVYTDATILDRLAILRDIHRAACAQLQGAI